MVLCFLSCPSFHISAMYIRHYCTAQRHGGDGWTDDGAAVGVQLHERGAVPFFPWLYYIPLPPIFCTLPRSFTTSVFLRSSWQVALFNAFDLISSFVYGLAWIKQFGSVMVLENFEGGVCHGASRSGGAHWPIPREDAKELCTNVLGWRLRRLPRRRRDGAVTKGIFTWIQYRKMRSKCRPKKNSCMV